MNSDLSRETAAFTRLVPYGEDGVGDLNTLVNQGICTVDLHVG